MARSDSDFEPIRDDPAFRDLISRCSRELEAVSSMACRNTRTRG